MIRFIYMLVALVYSVGVTGLHVNLHWCSGELASLNINALEQDACGCTDEDGTDDCCADAEFYVKVDNSHAAASGVVIPVLSQIALIPAPLLVLNSIDHPSFKFKNLLPAVDLPPPDLLVNYCCYLI